MRKPHIDDQVRLNQDIPELHLRSGMVGVVRSTWFAPTTAFEVEFDVDGSGTRALLLERQVTVAEDEGAFCAPALSSMNQDVRYWEP
jgi:hypothetical protein